MQQPSNHLFWYDMSKADPVFSMIIMGMDFNSLYFMIIILTIANLQRYESQAIPEDFKLRIVACMLQWDLMWIAALMKNTKPWCIIADCKVIKSNLLCWFIIFKHQVIMIGHNYVSQLAR